MFAFPIQSKKKQAENLGKNKNKRLNNQ